MTVLHSQRLPDFIGIGPPRTGTTWLHELLKGHVGLPRDHKETDFFSRNFANGLDWYREYFRDCDPALPIGEFSPTYFNSEGTPARIAEVIPRCKIICTLRDPVDRAWSHWRLMVTNAWTRAPFDEAIESLREVRESSSYGTYLKKWLDAFERAQVLVLIYDDLEREPQEFLDSTCDFIGIERFDYRQNPRGTERVHALPNAPRSRQLARQARKFGTWLTRNRFHRSYKVFRNSALWRWCVEGGDRFEPPSAEIDAAIRERYRPEIELLEKLIDRDLSAWKTPRARAGEDVAASNVSIAV